jgi:drug/metabolite transporter (DMT)-like permease
VSTSSKPALPPALVLVVGVLSTSFSAALVRWSQDEASSLVIAAMRVTLATLLVLPLALSRRRSELAAVPGRDWRLVSFAGLMLGLHFATWVASLEYTSVASSSVLVTTTPLWVALASPFFLGERLTRPARMGVALAVLGSMVIGLGDVISLEGGRLVLETVGLAGRQPVLGNGLALMGAVAGTAYFMVGRRLRPAMSLLSYIVVVYGAAAVILLAAVFLSGDTIFGYSVTTYLLFLAMAIFPQLIGHSSYNWALGYLPAAYVAVAIVGEPIGASIVAWLAFGEVPGPLTYLGSLLIFAGIIAANRPSPQR